jgi:hypothetical protein
MIAKGKSSFGDGDRQMTVLTQENGEASCDFLAATTPEICELRVALVNDPSQQWQTQLEIVPRSPARARS